MNANIEALKKEAALQRLSDFTQEADNKPVAWMGKDYDGIKTDLYFDVERNKLPYRLYESAIPLYTHQDERPHNTVLVPCDKLAEMQAEIEALKEKLDEAIDAEKDRRFE